jgi:protease-4
MHLMKLPAFAIVAALLAGLSVAPALADDDVATQAPPAPATPEKKPASTPEKPPVTTPEKNPKSPTDKPSPLPTQKKPADPDPEPSTRPADTGEQASAKAGESEFPTPAELIKRLQKQKAEKAALSKVVHFDLASAVVEKPADFSLFGDSTQMTLRSVINRMQMARDDKDVRAVLLTLGEPSLNFAQAQEVRDALVELRKAGKKTFVYSDSYDTVTYTLATGATDVCLMEGGEIMIPGVGMEAMFYKGLFDKLGVQADYVQIGEYKGAEEPYTRTTASEQLKGEMNKLAAAMYDQIVDGISQNRNLPPESVKQMIDDTMMPAKVAKERGFVDHLVDFHQLKELITSEMGNGLDIDSSFGQPRREQLDFSNPLALLSSMGKRQQEASAKPAIALVYAEGTIVDGDGGESILGGSSGVGSATIRKALRRAGFDENVKAIVIRIDSPGGSAQASEVMWQAARAVAGKKPVIVSIGSMAASGGYYLASAGDYIYADPSAIVGSIGVVGGKFVMKGLYDKLGLSTDTFTKGRNAGLFSSNQPFDERQRRLVTNWMKNTYDQFTQRVMTTRTGKIKDIDQVARGRIFLARQAKELGMVDEIGGVQAAIAYAANKAGLQSGQYDVKLVPTPRSLVEMLMGGAGADAETPIRPKVAIDVQGGELSLLLKNLDPTTRKALEQQLQIIQILQHRPVALVAPFAVTVR